MTKLGTATINGKSVSFFEPPHKDGPDFPWVDVKELAGAFLPPDAAIRMVEHAQRFGGDGERVVTVTRNGDDIATIICHALAQGLCGFIDQQNGFAPADADDAGPVHWQYCIAAGRFAADHWPLSFEGIIHAFHHGGGHFMQALRDE
ncbi:hypothetical protein [Devosia ginsengisoli]|uniref:hypothetical protein n=1 Tax=Devosia ginsengisoli TaxID=400770 RepID=UPI0026F2E527|nr:hypothetical protein [Devosia ginsengisoli]MCR6671460.1 hypothetical protein [Devosia ginsengisoli]